MNRSPLVSVMIPTYNQASFIEKAIESALAQDYENVEILVCDDNSLDNSKEILKRYQGYDKVKVFFNNINLGRVGNYKHLLQNHASGDWIINLDGDDYFTNNHFISKAMSLITSITSPVAFLQAGHTIQLPSGEVLSVSVPMIDGEYKVMDGKDYFLTFTHFSHLATIYNRQIAKELDFYRYDILSSDIESILRLALHGKVILLKESIGAWVQHGANESKNLSINVIEKNMLRFQGPYLYAKEKKAIPGNTLRSWLNRKINSYLVLYLMTYFKKPDKLKGYLTHVIKKYPARALIAIPVALFRSLQSK